MIDAPPFDIDTIVDDYLFSLEGNRPPEVLHVADLVDCARAVWWRRTGRPRDKFDADTLCKFQFGHAGETVIEKALIKKFGAGDVTRGEVVHLGHDIEGNLDLRVLTQGALVEVKTTTFRPIRGSYPPRREKPNEAREHYQIQAAGYCIARDIPWFCIYIICRESGQRAKFWYHAADYAAQIRDLAEFYRLTTDPAAPMPPAIPPSHSRWRCSYCSAIGCERRNVK